MGCRVSWLRGVYDRHDGLDDFPGCVVATSIGLDGTMACIAANEAATRFGRRRLIQTSMLASIAFGAAGSAEPARMGATLAVHSMLGYSGGFLVPLLIGWTLDLAGGMSTMGWGLAFLFVAVLMSLALLIFRLLRPHGLARDRAG